MGKRKIINKGKQTKRALDDKEMQRVIYEAEKMGDEAYKIVMIFRWTGMHVKVLEHPEIYNPHIEEDEEGEQYIVWKRTKKVGDKALTEVPMPVAIDFDVGDYFDTLRRRRASKNRRKISRQYFYDVVKKVGEEAKIEGGVSPMTFRHTLGVWMANQGYEENFIIQVLNCTSETAKTYLKRARKTRKPIYKRLGW